MYIITQVLDEVVKMIFCKKVGSNNSSSNNNSNNNNLIVNMRKKTCRQCRKVKNINKKRIIIFKVGYVVMMMVKVKVSTDRGGIVILPMQVA